jgi:hypothetical protein
MVGRGIHVGMEGHPIHLEAPSSMFHFIHQKRNEWMLSFSIQFHLPSIFISIMPSAANIYLGIGFPKLHPKKHLFCLKKTFIWNEGIGPTK